MNNQRPIKIATVFSGIGSFEFAFRRLKIDHKVIFACDNGEIELTGNEPEIKERLAEINSFTDKKKYIESLIPKNRINYVKKSYCANYKINSEDFHADVRFLDGRQYEGNVDIFMGGSPCQSFTLLGYQRGLEEVRGTLFYEFARLVNEIKPKAFIYENVQGLVKHDKGRTWEVVKRVFESLGYHLSPDILDASDYGIPQKRRRIFVIGFRENINEFSFPLKKKLQYTMQDFLLNNVAEGDFISQEGNIEFTKKGQKVNEKYFLSERILPGIMCHGTGGFSMKPEIDLPVARPLMSSMHKMHRAGEDNYVTDGGRIRRLTPRECLRLMGFTDDFDQVVSDTQMYRQAGNSVVVDVLMGLINQIIKHI